MKKILSTATKTLAVALAASTISFAGPGLADGASKFVGNITTRGQVRSDFGQYWNQITAENECKWQSVEGSRGNRNFSGCKNAYNWAKQNGGLFKFHALLWGSQYPTWLESLGVDDTKKAIMDWFDAVKQNFDELDMIDVVNEAIRTGNNQYHSNYPKTKIIQAMGGDNNGDYMFIVNAFKEARKRWPNAVLIYNDYNTVQWNLDQGIDLIKTIKKNGAPVDAYGLQAHDMMTQGGGANGTGGGGNCLALSTLKSALEKIWNNTQTPMLISEYDINSSSDDVQKTCYEQQISYFMENEHVGGITIWGYINGATWLDNSGIIDGNRDRAAMTWLKQYLPSHPGNNTTGLLNSTPIEPEPQTPFKGQPFAVPGKIEAEDFDVPGKGRNEDGTTNNSFSEADTENHGDSDYRKDTGVDLYKKATGIVVGYNNEGDWLEYTIDVKTAGDYTLFAAVAAAGSTSSLQFSLDEKELTDKISVPAASSGEENYEDYNKVSVNVTLPAGKHILRMTVTGAWFDVDYFTLVEGKNATDPEPIIKDDDPGTDAIPQTVAFDDNAVRQDYHVFDMNGMFMGVLTAYGFDAAKQILQTSNDVKTSGIYLLRNRLTGQMQKVRVVR